MWPAKFVQIDKKYLEEKILSYYSQLSDKKEDFQKAKKKLESLKKQKTLDQNISGLVDFCIGACDDHDEFDERKVRDYLELASCHHLNGDSPDIVKKVLKKGAQDYLRFLQNFTPREKNVEVLVWKQTFNKNDRRVVHYEEHDQDRRYYAVTYKNTESLIEASWLAAIFCCVGCDDKELLESIITQYMWPSKTSKVLIVKKPFLIQMLYLKNMEMAKEQIAIYHKGYCADTPPERQEIMQGILENNPSVFMDGIKKIQSRFTAMWTMSQFVKRGFNNPKKIIDDLIDFRWVFSEWAIIGLYLAKMYSLNLNYDKIPETFIPKYLYAE